MAPLTWYLGMSRRQRWCVTVRPVSAAPLVSSFLHCLGTSPALLSEQVAGQHLCHPAVGSLQEKKIVCVREREAEGRREHACFRASSTGARRHPKQHRRGLRVPYGKVSSTLWYFPLVGTKWAHPLPSAFWIALLMRLGATQPRGGCCSAERRLRAHPGAQDSCLLL